METNRYNLQQTGRLTKQYNLSVKTLTVEWTVEEYSYSPNVVITSDTFWTEQYPSSRWFIRIRTNGSGSDNDGFISVHLIKADDKNMAKVDIKFTIGRVARNAFGNYLSSASEGGKFISSSDLANNLAIGGKDLILLVDITYHDNFDKLDMELNKDTNTLNGQ